MTPSQRCLILTPTGNDSNLISEALSAVKLATLACRNVNQLCQEIHSRGAGVVILAQESADEAGILELRACLEQHPAWSVLPFVLLTSSEPGGDPSTTDAELFGPHAIITLVERPCSTATLVSAVRSGLSLRQRQHQMQALLEQLDSQAQELNRSNAELYRFASAAAHDLQAPLRLITSYLSLIEEHGGQQLDQRSQDYLRKVIGSAQAMRELIHALLEYAQVGASKPALQDLPAEQALGEALHTLSPSIEEVRPEIRIGELPEIRADRTLIVLLFQNLVGNAIKYRKPQATLSIEISASDSGHEWIFTVADSGIGIAAEDFERIFGAFERLHSPDAFMGYGIGLATCKRIVELHGGRIWVESTLDVGSRFRFSLAK